MTAKNPNPWHRSDELIFDGYPGKLRKSATPADVLAAAFADPRVSAADFVGGVLLATADELSALGSMLAEDDQDLASRVVLRLATRLECAADADRRMRQADEIQGDGDIFIVPRCDDEAFRDFDRARLATIEDLGKRGYVKRSAAMKALNILVRDEPTNIDNEKPEAAE